MGRPDAMETGTFYPTQLFSLRTLGGLGWCLYKDCLLCQGEAETNLWEQVSPV